MIQGINNTSNDTFRRLFGNGLMYKIPKYQRDYSWGSEQWSDLWHDIQQARDENSSHYMGYLVLQTSDNKCFQVIDGQQRLTTICILILALIKNIQELDGTDAEKEANEVRAATIRATYIGNLDTLTLIAKNKLELNRNGNDFFKRYLVPLEPFPKRGLKVSEKLMRDAFEFFAGEIKKSLKSIEDLIAYTDTLADILYFTVITVTDELNAFKVFETLNARGVQLSTSDLLKNYFFSLADAVAAHSTEVDELENLWGIITGKLETIQFSEYLRVYWNSTHPTVRKTDLYKTIRESIKTLPDAFSLLRELSRQADTFLALHAPEDELWKGQAEIKGNLQLLKLFGITQPFSLLLTAYRYLDTTDFASLLTIIVNISFRYNTICGKNPNEQEFVYNALSVNIFRTKKLDITLLKPVYIADQEFEQSFSVKEFKKGKHSSQLVRYILSSIEQRASGVALDPDDYTLEHILPESSDQTDWPLPDYVVSQYKYRLGNMLLLEKTINKDIGSKSFIEKKQLYLNSKVPMAREIADSTDTAWGEAQIEKRQNSLAKIAKGVWCIQKLDRY